MKALKTKAETRPAEPEQESYPVYCKNPVEKTDWKGLVDQFVEYQEGIGRRPRTIENHRIGVKYFTDYLDGVGVTNLAGVTPQVIAGYQAHVYQYRTRFGRAFKLNSQIIVLNNVQVFFKYLLKAGHILSNPAEGLKLPKEPRKIPGTILTTQEMRKLLQQPDTGTVLGFRDRTMYEVLYSTGLRVGELTGMRVQDLVLPSSASAGEGEPRRSPDTLAVVGTKTGFSAWLNVAKSKNFKERHVPLGEAACRYLQEYLDRIRPMLLRTPLDVVFISRTGKQLDHSGVELKLRIYAGRAGIEKHITVHTFRHTLATEMLRRGADLRQIQELLGHKQLRSTQVYTHVFRGELRRIQSHCHPREQTDLPDGFTAYRGRDYLTEDEIAKEKRHSK